jgi:hypothetical protein
MAQLEGRVMVGVQRATHLADLVGPTLERRNPRLTYVVMMSLGIKPVARSWWRTSWTALTDLSRFFGFISQFFISVGGEF